MRLFAAFGIAVALAILGCQMAPVQVTAEPPEPMPEAPATLPSIPPPDGSAAQVPDGYKVEVAVKDLTYPTSVDFDDAGNMYVAEGGYVYGDHSAPGRILQVTPQGK